MFHLSIIFPHIRMCYTTTAQNSKMFYFITGNSWRNSILHPDVETHNRIKVKLRIRVELDPDPTPQKNRICNRFRKKKVRIQPFTNTGSKLFIKRPGSTSSRVVWIVGRDRAHLRIQRLGEGSYLGRILYYLLNSFKVNKNKVTEDIRRNDLLKGRLALKVW